MHILAPVIHTDRQTDRERPTQPCTWHVSERYSLRWVLAPLQGETFIWWSIRNLPAICNSLFAFGFSAAIKKIKREEQPVNKIHRWWDRARVKERETERVGEREQGNGRLRQLGRRTEEEICVQQCCHRARWWWWWWNFHKHTHIHSHTQTQARTLAESASLVPLFFAKSTRRNKNINFLQLESAPHAHNARNGSIPHTHTHAHARTHLAE